jgi:hypothetical protein
VAIEKFRDWVASEQSKIMGMATTLNLASLPIRVAGVTSLGQKNNLIKQEV